jgi:hypothetical protein
MRCKTTTFIFLGLLVWAAGIVVFISSSAASSTTTSVLASQQSYAAKGVRTLSKRLRSHVRGNSKRAATKLIDEVPLDDSTVAAVADVDELAAAEALPASSPSASDETTSPPPTPLVKASSIAVVVFTFNRASALKRTLDGLLARLPDDGTFDLHVSLQGEQPGMMQTLQPYTDPSGGSGGGGGSRARVRLHRYTYQPFDIATRDQAMAKRFPNYYKIAHHYRFALSTLFDKEKYDVVVAMEDDMDIAPDFFQYFAHLRPLVDDNMPSSSSSAAASLYDPSLLCVSAWNDNGQRRHTQHSDASSLHRTDVFPGLGWMLGRAVWADIGPRWPGGFWDDWLREPPQRRGRSCIFPEVNRVYTFGKEGASNGQFFDQYLKSIRLADTLVDWASLPAAATSSATSAAASMRGDAYGAELQRRVAAAHLVPLSTLGKRDVASQTPPLEGGEAVKAVYNSLEKGGGRCAREKSSRDDISC